jgi:hypothetical protein
MLEQILAIIQAEAARTGPGRHTISFGARSLPFALPVTLLRDIVAVSRAVVDPADGEDPEDTTDEPSMEDPGAPVEMDGAMSYTCSGTASSTSVDWYGTEMSRACLDDMAGQFERGVGVFVGHGGFFGDGIEWTDEIGVTFGAEVADADVVEPANSAERGAVCKVAMRFEYDGQSSNKTKDAVRALAQRLARKRPLGLSIGGWFRDVTYLTDENGELERVIINKVDLDHLATTRRPANPDCLDMAMLSRAVREGLRTRSAPAAAAPATPAAPAPSAPSARELDEDAPKLSDSEYEQPPHEYVADLKENWPDIWSAGGNVRGNEAYGLWTRALDGDDAAEVLDWIREREAWAARHTADFRLAGVVAQLKWGVVGSRGYDHQKEVVEARKEELDAEGEEAKKSAARTETRGTPPYADLPLAPEDEPWDYGTAEEDEVLGESGDNWERYKRGHFWFDPENQEVKAGYKLPFAKMIDGELRAVWNGVSAAMNVMQGGRGGVDMPDEDREPVYNHIVRYYEKFGKEAPELKSAPSPGSSDSTTPDTNEPERAKDATPEQDAADNAVVPRATTTPGDAREEIDMTPEQLQAMLTETLNQMLNARGIGAAPVQTQAALDLDAGNTRAGQASPTVPLVTLTAPAGADLIRSRAIVADASANPGNLRADMAPTMRQITFGRAEGFTDSTLISTYQTPSPAQRRAVLLGVAHHLRTIGASAELADVVQDSADVLSLDIVGLRGLRAESQADKDRVGSEAPGLLLRALRQASADGHPVFKAPGQREAITRALTVSNASDKVTTALVSSVLQQLSNVQLGARTQLRRIPGAGTNYQTPKRTVSSTLAEWLADGTAPTEDSGSWGYDTWAYRTIGTRFKATRKAQAQGAQWGDIVAAEALNKGEDFNRQEEVTIFQGDNANSLPTANAPNGLLTLIGATSSQRIANTTANAGDTLSIQKLDETIGAVKGRENKANLRIFASTKGYIYLNNVLQADQTFMNVVMAQAGFIVQTYQGIPIVESSGIPDVLVWNGTAAQITTFSTGATTALVVVNLTHAYLVVLTPMTVEQVSTTTAQYQEFEMFADEVIVLDNPYGGAYLGGIKVV